MWVTILIMDTTPVYTDTCEILGPFVPILWRPFYCFWKLLGVWASRRLAHSPSRPFPVGPRHHSRRRSRGYGMKETYSVGGGNSRRWVVDSRGASILGKGCARTSWNKHCTIGFSHSAEAFLLMLKRMIISATLREVLFMYLVEGGCHPQWTPYHGSLRHGRALWARFCRVCGCALRCDGEQRVSKCVGLWRTNVCSAIVKGVSFHLHGYE